MLDHPSNSRSGSSLPSSPVYYSGGISFFLPAVLSAQRLPVHNQLSSDGSYILNYRCFCYNAKAGESTSGYASSDIALLPFMPIPPSHIYYAASTPLPIYPPFHASLDCLRLLRLRNTLTTINLLLPSPGNSEMENLQKIPPPI